MLSMTKLLPFREMVALRWVGSRGVYTSLGGEYQTGKPCDAGGQQTPLGMHLWLFVLLGGPNSQGVLGYMYIVGEGMTDDLNK